MLAGLHVKGSSSKKQEQDLIDKHVNLRGSVHSLGHVTTDERTWMLSNAEALLYPSSSEGFGFVPYESTAVGIPSIFTSFGPLEEIFQLTDLPNSWNTSRFATEFGVLITDSESFQERVNRLKEISDQLSWRDFADALTNFFGSVVQLPVTPVAAFGSTSTADSAALAQVLSSKSWKFTAPIRRVIERSQKP